MTLTQKTIRREVSCAGIGLHSGERVKMRLLPAAPGTGIRFRRVDLGGREIAVAIENLHQTSFATQLTDGEASISTVEHVLSAASGLGVDNLLIELEGPEVPIMDGSATPFVYLLHEAGLKRQQAARTFIKIVEPLRVDEDDKFIAVYPAERLKISYTIDFDHPLIGIQRETFLVTPRAYTEQLAPARTFGFLRDVETMRSLGLALGGSMENAIVVGENSILNPQLRFPDEFVRHKIMDAIGDLTLLGAPLLGHVVAYRAGHGLHAGLVEKIRDTPEAWEAVTWDDIVYEIASRRTVAVPASI
ncbi:MAG: UDP-3-O-acyl-N-acetylglucosamine deacetylase [Acidobacteria bacterium]|nr:UDP-3-O-acyl-N-acetylglucosamine deacetylase [Acidobacteriota bacterium]